MTLGERDKIYPEPEDDSTTQNLTKINTGGFQHSPLSTDKLEILVQMKDLFGVLVPTAGVDIQTFRLLSWELKGPVP